MGIKKTLGAVIFCTIVPALADASPILLLCKGSLDFYPELVNKTFDSESAAFDANAGTFDPPSYPRQQVLGISETKVNFGSEGKYSVWGSLDRVSGAIVMNVMRPEERKKMQAGESAQINVSLQGSCKPAKPMF